MVEEGRVHKSLYSDPEIFEAELDKVFNNNWVFVGHESEVPEAGSFKTAFIGRQPIIMSRDRKMNIHVLQNRCRHRGATVCEGRKGKTKAFTCPYHGWGYGLDGSLRALPKPEEYDGVINKDEMPLESLRWESWRGISTSPATGKSSSKTPLTPTTSRLFTSHLSARWMTPPLTSSISSTVRVLSKTSATVTA
jgi:phenylpropionate dioxygenase-like ring-hydroxylating dioxygenase large terminal subunit